MSENERAALAAQMEREIRPLLDQDKYRGGYNCCGCGTYDDILQHALHIVWPEEYGMPTP